METSLKKAQIWDAVMSLDDETDHVLDEVFFMIIWLFFLKFCYLQNLF